jgi:hypothetical protein
MNVYNSVAAVTGLPRFPDFGFSVPLPAWLKSERSRAFGHVYKNIVRDLAQTDQLGSVRDLMVSRTTFEKGWEARYSPPKTEDPRFRRVASDWKIPM